MKKLLILLAIVFVSFSAYSQTKQNQNLEVFGITKKIPFSLTGTIYALKKNTMYLPESFNKNKAIGTINTTKLDIRARMFRSGFPGLSDRFEWFAIDYHGFFYINEPDEYVFALESDDGSKLFINDKLLVNNDGCHEPRTKYGSVYLKKGVHRMNVQYFQGPREIIALRLLYKTKNSKHFQVFSYEEFKPITISEPEITTGVTQKQDGIKANLTIELDGSVLFDFDDATLKQEAKQILSEIYTSYAENDTVGIVIEGHTDNMGSDEYNKILALKRARSVENYFKNNYKVSQRIWSIGIGEVKPKYENNNEENRSKNRRVEILLMHKDKAKEYYSKSTTYIYK